MTEQETIDRAAFTMAQTGERTTLMWGPLDLDADTYRALAQALADAGLLADPTAAAVAAQERDERTRDRDSRPTPHHGTIVCIYHRGAFQVWDAACECGWRDEDLTTWAYAYWALHRHQTEETA